MCFHVFCAVFALLRGKTIGYYKNDDVDGGKISNGIFLFLTFFPVIVIPVFWIVYITTNHDFDTISIVFVTLYGTLLFSILLFFIFSWCNINGYIDRWSYYILSAISGTIFFYVPNFLQT